jgi:hypothetical protein
MLKPLLSEIENTIKHNQNVVAAMYVGSSAVNFDRCNDVDIIVLCKEIEQTHSLDESICTILGTNSYRNIDVLRYESPKLEGKEISLAVRQVDKFKEDLFAIISGDAQALLPKQVNWAVGGYFPEILYKDFINAKVFVDNTNWVSKLIEDYAGKIPESLRNGIVTACSSLIEQKINIIDKLLPAYKEIAKSEIVITLIRLIFISQGYVYPGSKHIYEIMPLLKPTKQELLEKIINLDAFEIDLIKSFYKTAVQND